MLWHAFHINRALGIDDNVTSTTYDELRNALVKTVRDIHVTYDEVRDRLPRIAGFMRRFSTVVSLNYDFLVYWAMLVGNKEWGQNWFKDCFIHGKFDPDWAQYREPYGIANGSTLVFYPHGNMVLATNLFGEEIKLITEEFESLLDTIIGKWEVGEYTPLFVSEGTSSQKLHAISRSAYLTSVYNTVLPELGNRIVIFGWSMSDNDQHILDAVARAKPHVIAVSVRRGHKDLDDHCAAIERKLKRAPPKMKSWW